MQFLQSNKLYVEGPHFPKCFNTRANQPTKPTASFNQYRGHRAKLTWFFQLLPRPGPQHFPPYLAELSCTTLHCCIHPNKESNLVFA